jgi:kynurenine formamidase
MSNDWVDISVPIYTGMVRWPDNPPMRVDYLLHLEHGLR